MTKPANLEYAFPLTATGLDGQTFGFVAYRVIGTPFDGVINYWSEEASLSPGQDITTGSSDGDGSVGQYVVFGWRSGHSLPPWQSEANVAADIGWDPFDPANHKPTTVRYWELQPGSDVMATTLGVLPKIGDDGGGGHEFYAGLVTLPAPANGTVDQVNIDLGDGLAAAWRCFPADTAITVDGMSAADWATPGSTVVVARYMAPAGSPPPLAFPAGWTPGNTTGSGPVLPLLGDLGGGYVMYAGLVNVNQYPADGFPSGDDWGWGVSSAGTTNEKLLAQTNDNPPPFTGAAIAYYYASDGSVPTALPAGVTFRPYGLGPIAITDENAGGVIGDIAYVVSGFVYGGAESTDSVYAADPNYQGVVAVQHYDVGDVFYYVDGIGKKQWKRVTAAGNVTATYGTGGFGGAAGFAYTNLPSLGPVWDGLNGDYVWPFLERYNLKTKTWLPRIQLPSALMGVPLTNLGAWDIGHGEYARGSVVTESGKTWIAYKSTMGVPSGGLGYWVEEGAPFPYAAEGGIAGVINGKLYFGGGDGDNITGNEFFVYDPATEEFTRLPDIALAPGQGYTGDYSPFGVVGGKFYTLGHDGDDGPVANVYDPVANAWSTPAMLANDLQNVDQIQGLEVDGKCYFAHYGFIYAFDPTRLTVTPSPELYTSHPDSNFSTEAGASLYLARPGVLGVVGYESPQPNVVEYDLVAQAWNLLPRPPGPWPSGYTTIDYHVMVAYKGAPYVLSGLRFGTVHQPGVWGLTGNVPTYTAPGEPKALTHLGFSSRQAALLQSAPEDKSLYDLYHSGFSMRQARTIKRGVFTMQALMRGGFNRHQAKALRRD